MQAPKKKEVKTDPRIEEERQRKLKLREINEQLEKEKKRIKKDKKKKKKHKRESRALSRGSSEDDGQK